MQDMNVRELILNSIKDKSITVSFTKKDGSNRDMLCTLAESLIPADQKPKTENTKFSDDALRVFDLDKQQWRSFRWDSIKTVKGI